jgi:hypothetical protein
MVLQSKDILPKQYAELTYHKPTNLSTSTLYCRGYRGVEAGSASIRGPVNAFLHDLTMNQTTKVVGGLV